MAADADKDDHSPDVPIRTKAVHFNEDNMADMNVIHMIDQTHIYIYLIKIPKNQSKIAVIYMLLKKRIIKKE